MRPQLSIGIVGGTGPAGSALALRLASIGHQVLLGSREPDKSVSLVSDLVGSQAGMKLDLVGASNEMAASCDIVVVATPWDSMGKAISPFLHLLEGKIVISMANALSRVGGELQATIPARGSAAQTLQASIPGAMVVAALHHLPAKELGELGTPLDADVLVCSDHRSAATAVIELISGIPGVRCFDAGSLSQAGPIEAMTAVLINLNIRYKTRCAIRITGIKQ